MCLQLPSLHGHWSEMFIFWGACTALGNLLPGATSSWLSGGGHTPSGTLILSLPAHFYIILCPVPATTQRYDSFKTWWYCKSLTIKWRSVFYGCSLGVFMSGQTICLLLQHLMEAAAITCEGSAIFSKSQNKIQPWWGVLGCFLYINPQLPPFKVSRVFNASEMVHIAEWLGSNAAQTY